jgi:hypothetical protein
MHMYIRAYNTENVRRSKLAENGTKQNKKMEEQDNASRREKREETSKTKKTEVFLLKGKTQGGGEYLQHTVLRRQSLYRPPMQSKWRIWSYHRLQHDPFRVRRMRFTVHSHPTRSAVCNPRF